MLLAVTPDSFIPEEHPIRRIKPIVESVLARLSPLFDAMYAERGRPTGAIIRSGPRLDRSRTESGPVGPCLEPGWTCDGTVAE
jgi:hypothetical protein